MQLSDYENKISEIEQDVTLTGEQKHAILEQVAFEIDRCAWQYSARPAAESLAAKARTCAAEYPDGGLDGLKSAVVETNYLKAK